MFNRLFISIYLLVQTRTDGYDINLLRLVKHLITCPFDPVLLSFFTFSRKLK